jgi:hypothetical protein
MTLSELFKDDVDTLPDDALRTVREFVLFLKVRVQREGAWETAALPSRDTGRKRRLAGFRRLMKHRASLDREIRAETELMEALDERHQSMG